MLPYNWIPRIVEPGTPLYYVANEIDKFCMKNPWTYDVIEILQELDVDMLDGKVGPLELSLYTATIGLGAIYVFNKKRK